MVGLAGCELDVERGPGWLLVRVRDVEKSAAGPTNLADELWAVAERHFTYRIVLELDRVQVLNSRWIGELIRLCKQLEEHDGVLRLCGLTPYNRRILLACTLASRFPTYDTREEAVKGDANPHLPR